jgi:hypothetical protein
VHSVKLQTQTGYEKLKKTSSSLTALLNTINSRDVDWADYTLATFIAVYEMVNESDTVPNNMFSF